MRVSLSSLLTLSLVVFATSPSAFAADYRKILNLDQAHEITRGSEEMVIASLNTGVNYELPELRGRVVREADGTYGYDAATGKKDSMDVTDFGLGTKVASMIVGNTLGVAPNAKVLSIRVFDANGSSNWNIISRGIQYALSKKAKIIEFGGGPLTGIPVDLCKVLKQVDDAGALLVVPAGNSSTAWAEYPAGCEISNVIVAAASDEKGALASFSDYGFPAVQVAAPGTNLKGIGRDGVISTNNSGTSFSAALTAGTAALVWSAHPEYTAQQVRKALIRGSLPSTGVSGKVLSNGILNALEAIQANTTQVE